ncbi:MAG: potassium transporter TrkA [Planctomycetota bacterium]|nr:MAG: potassium transporter TrkA [Planctomycetota bacterium]
MTGVSEELARFQARSAFTGCGFTTSESESVVDHPVRRRIIFTLMLLGSAGLPTAIASLLLGFLRAEGAVEIGTRLGVIAAGLLGLYLLARSAWVRVAFATLVEAALERWTDLEVRDYVDLLRLQEGFRVAELRVNSGDWLAGVPLRELRLPDEGVTVLGIARPDGSYIAVPHGDTVIEPGDVVTLYGSAERLRELDARKAGPLGDREHRAAVEDEAARRRLQDEAQARGAAGEGAP